MLVDKGREDVSSYRSKNDKNNGQPNRHRLCDEGLFNVFLHRGPLIDASSLECDSLATCSTRPLVRCSCRNEARPSYEEILAMRAGGQGRAAHSATVLKDGGDIYW